VDHARIVVQQIEDVLQGPVLVVLVELGLLDGDLVAQFGEQRGSAARRYLGERLLECLVIVAYARYGS
jgi:hypothetical protein